MNDSKHLLVDALPSLRIDIISDVMCPWCAIGYLGLKQALEELKGELKADIHWQPFELNPNMPREGQELGEHIMEKYGSTAEESKRNRDHIVSLGANLDFEFNFAEGKCIVNTFNAHQLLHWAGETSDKQTELKMALLIAYFKEGRDVSDIEVLAEIAVEVGLDDSLDASFSKQLLQDQVYAGDVRALQEQWRGMGISAVPSFIIDEKYIISGGQSPSAFVQGLRQMIEGK